jgi:trigger factor
MSVLLSNEEVGPCRRALKIEVPEPAVEAESQRVVAAMRRGVQIPGFRKGKVPEAVVRRRYREEIESEVLDRLVPRYWQQAQDEAGLAPMLPPKISDVHLHAGQPLTFVATVEIKPEIELRNITDFELPELEETVSAAEVEEALNDTRRQRGTWHAVEREAARGDKVRLTVLESPDAAPDDRPGEDAAEETAEAPAGEAAEDAAQDAGDADAPRERSAEIEVGDPNVWEELSLAVTGLGAGKQTEFTRKEGEGEEAVERHLKVRIEEVQELEMPPLDDDFARGLGDFDSVAALQHEVERQLAKAKRAESRRQRESALLLQLAERHPFPLPEGVVDHEVRHMLEDYASNLARRGIDPEKAGLDWQAMADQSRPQAEMQVRIRLLLDAIAEQEGIEVTEDQFERTLAAVARSQGSSAPALRKSLDEAGKLSGLRAQLRREAVVRQLLGEPPLSTAEESHQHEADDDAPAAAAVDDNDDEGDGESAAPAGKAAVDDAGDDDTGASDAETEPSTAGSEDD